MTWGDFRYRDTIYRCFRCGYCKFPSDWADVNSCPPYGRFRMETYSCGGRLWLARAWLSGQLDWSEHLAEVLYSCTTCRSCEIKCPLGFHVDIVNMVVAARGEMVERGRLPATTKTFLENVELYGNPYGSARSRRGEWAEGTGVEAFDGHEHLFYAGCAGSYDTRARRAARAVALLLRKAGVSFGILGAHETCDGNEVRKLGEEGLFEELVRRNIASFRERGVRSVITLSPHALNAFRNYYPAYGGSFSVLHYTQVLRHLLETGRLGFPGGFRGTVAYHDPCFLGRWNGEYETPREVLQRISGVRLVELERNREGALCCGGGGGNFCMDLLGGAESSPSRRRVREALASGADVLATACPKLGLVMLEDAVISEGCEDRLAVRDIAEIAAEACGRGRLAAGALKAD
jgi:Fe-S oxidoreductase